MFTPLVQMTAALNLNSKPMDSAGISDTMSRKRKYHYSETELGTAQVKRDRLTAEEVTCAWQNVGIEQADHHFVDKISTAMPKEECVNDILTSTRAKAGGNNLNVDGEKLCVIVSLFHFEQVLNIALEDVTTFVGNVCSQKKQGRCGITCPQQKLRTC